MELLAVVAFASCACAFLLLGIGAQRRAVTHLSRPAQKLLEVFRGKGAPGETEVPSMLDIVTLGLSAGLSFDASLELYCERFDGRLSQALEKALLAWRLGVLSRSDALKRAAQVADAPSLAEVAAMVEEALELGFPVAEALTRQADALRGLRRASVEERIERVPIKLLIPMGTLVVPAMLLAILGPILGSVIELGP